MWFEGTCLLYGEHLVERGSFDLVLEQVDKEFGIPIGQHDQAIAPPQCFQRISDFGEGTQMRPGLHQFQHMGWPMGQMVQGEGIRDGPPYGLQISAMSQVQQGVHELFVALPGSPGLPECDRVDR